MRHLKSNEESDLVPRKRLEREKRARFEAENLLEEKSAALFEANQKILKESRALKRELNETASLRKRENEAAYEKEIVSNACGSLADCVSATDALNSLLNSLRNSFDVEAANFVQLVDQCLQVTISTSAVHVGATVTQPIEDLSTKSAFSGTGAKLFLNNSVERISEADCFALCPIMISNAPNSAIMLMRSHGMSFSPREIDILSQVIHAAEPVIQMKREERRNSVLAALLEGRHLHTHSGVIDEQFEAIERAFIRIADIQTETAQINSILMDPDYSEASNKISGVLKRACEKIGFERAHLFYQNDMSERFEVTARCGSNGSENRAKFTLQSLQKNWENFRTPDDIYLSQENEGETNRRVARELFVTSPNKLFAALLITENTHIKGIVVYECRGENQNLTNAEVTFLGSVARNIGAFLGRKFAHQAIQNAHNETLAQQERLEAVLAAIPDLIIELDGEGRITHWHSEADNKMLGDMLPLGKHLEFLAPKNLKGITEEILSEIRAGNKLVTREVELNLSRQKTLHIKVLATAMGEQGFVFVIRDISKEVEQIAEIQLLSDIARRTSNMVIVADEKRRVVWVNEEFEKNTGWSLHEIKGKVAGHFLQTEKTDKKEVAKIRRALDAVEPVQAEILNKTKNGKEYWVAIDIQPLFKADGSHRGFMALERNVTERRRQAEKLEEAASSEAKARAILAAAIEALPDGFALFDNEDRLVIFNEKYKEVYADTAPAIKPGVTFEELLRFGLEKGQYPEAIGREEKWIQERLNAHQKTFSVIEQQLSDGRWIRSYEQATPDGGRVGLRVDITELKLAEMRAKSDLSEAMDSSQDGIAVSDTKGNFLFVNPSLLSIFGYNHATDIINNGWRSLFPPEERAWISSFALSRLKEEKSWSGELVGQKSDNSFADIDLSLTLKKDGGVLWVFRDISEKIREQHEQERLREMLHKSQRREMFSQFAAGIAHDFNNLLATISGNAELIRNNVKSDPGAQKTLRRIEDATVQASDLLGKLLAFGSRENSRVLTDVRPIVSNAVELASAGLDRNKKLYVAAPEEPIEAYVDKSDVLQTILNLSLNARDAIGDKPGVISIVLRNSNKEDEQGPFEIGQIKSEIDYFCLEVSDTGSGISPDELEKIFRPWYTTKGDSGSGLGLSVVSSIITSNSAALKVNSQQDVGTKFTICWPKRALGSPLQNKKPIESVSTSGRLDGKAVLVVDDQPQVLDVIAKFLEEAGAEVGSSIHPSDALEVFRENPESWDAVITDYDMPDMNGAALADAIKQANPSIPIILITALAGVDGRSGDVFDATLKKPISRIELVFETENAIMKQKT